MTRRVRNGSPGAEETDPGPPGAWVARASCSGMVLQLLNFFGNTRVEWGTSKQVCHSCPVRRDCLAYALDAKTVHGVWGGLDPLELRFTLGRDAQGTIWTYGRSDVKCPYCRGATEALELSEDEVTRKCESCGFSWVRAERKKPKRTRRKAGAAV